MLTESQIKLFTKFRVGAFGRKIAEIIEDPAWDDVGFEDKIEAALQAEVNARHDRRVEKLIAKSHFKMKEACLEDVIYRTDRSLTRDRMKRFCACDWVRDTENLLILSETGGGKSYIAQAIGNAAMRQEISSYYVTASDLERIFSKARDDDRYFERLDELSEIGLLIIDDLFTIAPNELFVTDLFRLLDARENRTSTIVCSQTTPDVWYELIGIEIVADSLLNRLVKRARVITIKGPNMREVLAQETKEKPGYWS